MRPRRKGLRSFLVPLQCSVLSLCWWSEKVGSRGRVGWCFLMVPQHVRDEWLSVDRLPAIHLQCLLGFPVIWAAASCSCRCWRKLVTLTGCRRVCRSFHKHHASHGGLCLQVGVTSCEDDFWALLSSVAFGFWPSSGFQVILGIPPGWGCHFISRLFPRDMGTAGAGSVSELSTRECEGRNPVTRAWLTSMLWYPVALGTCGVPDNVQVFLSPPFWCSVHQFCGCQGA